jgi:hypothetical protein
VCQHEVDLAHHAEVGEQRRAVATHEHVRRFDVEVQQAIVVYRLHGARDVADDAHEHPGGVRLESLGSGGRAEAVADDRHVVLARRIGQQVQDAGQRQPVDPLHRDRERVAVRDDVVDGDDVGMRDLGHRPALVQQPLAGALLPAVPVGHDLERHVPAERVVSRQVDAAHAAAADLAEHGVPRDAQGVRTAGPAALEFFEQKRQVLAQFRSHHVERRQGDGPAGGDVRGAALFQFVGQRPVVGGLGLVHVGQGGADYSERARAVECVVGSCAGQCAAGRMRSRTTTRAA